MTQLIVIRHGAQVHAGYGDDALKVLSEEGRITQRKVAMKLKEEGVTPTLILTSPLIRAVQSAEILGEVLEAPVEEEAALGAEFDEEALLNRLPPPEKGETLIMVGHMPTLADFVERLVGERVLPHGIGKSGVVKLLFPKEIGWGKAQLV